MEEKEVVQDDGFDAPNPNRDPDPLPPPVPEPDTEPPESRATSLEFLDVLDPAVDDEVDAHAVTMLYFDVRWSKMDGRLL